MKADLTIAIARLLNFCSECYGYVKTFFAKIQFKCAKEEELDEMIKKNFLNQRTPFDLQNWIRANFQYEYDLVDYPKNPFVFMYDKCGDCEDFAKFCEILLPKLGYKNIYLVNAMSKNKLGHTVCVAEKGNRIYGFGNWNLLNFESHDLEEMGEMICQKMNSSLWFVLKYQDGKFIEGLVDEA